MKKQFLLLFISITFITTAQKPNYTAYFDFNKSDLTSTQKEKLSNWLKLLSTKKVSSLKIIGHCDSIGNYDYNLELSKKRALYVKGIISKSPTDLTAFDFKSFSSPRAKNATEKGRTLNRRVDIYVKYNKTDCLISSQNTTDSISLSYYENKTVSKEIKLTSNNSFDATETKLISFNQKGSLPLTLSTENINCPIVLIPIKTNARYTLKETHFIPNTPKFMDGSQAELENLLLTMQKNPTVQIKLEGHTNGVSTKKDPSWHYNMSTQRAQAVRNYLTSHGVSESRIEHQGYGCDRMINPQGQTPEERTANRRVEVLVLKE